LAISAVLVLLLVAMGMRHSTQQKQMEGQKMQIQARKEEIENQKKVALFQFYPFKIISVDQISSWKTGKGQKYERNSSWTFGIAKNGAWIAWTVKSNIGGNIEWDEQFVGEMRWWPRQIAVGNVEYEIGDGANAKNGTKYGGIVEFERKQFWGEFGWNLRQWKWGNSF
jgi:hypothetical protein